MIVLHCVGRSLPESDSRTFRSHARSVLARCLSDQLLYCMFEPGMTQYSEFAPEKAIKIFRSTLAKENNEVRERGAVLLN